jgi:outer membrane receptor protein involved in Fe transport
MRKIKKGWQSFLAIRTVVIVLSLFVVTAWASGNTLLKKQHSEVRYNIEVPASGAIDAFNILAEQTGTEFLFSYDLAKSRTTQSVSGKYSLIEALNLMLQYSGLSCGLSEKGAIRIFLSEGSMINNQEKTVNTKKTILSAILAALFSSSSTAQVDAVLNENEKNEAEIIENIIVTGRANFKVQSKKESSNAITTLPDYEIRQKAPVSVADLLSLTPGFSVEASGGVSGANIRPRGLPSVGGYRHLSLQEDGLPVFHDGQLNWLNSDQFFRHDETIERVEAVRGGAAPVFASNAAGGIANFITRRGTEDFEGLVKFTTSDSGEFRTDFNVSGALSDDWLASIGGFYRRDDGVRDPGFTANKGGQVRFSLTRKLDNGSITFLGKHIDDRNQFLLPIPLTNLDNPSQFGGFDANYGTYNSNELRLVNLKTADGDVTQDLAEGTHVKLTSLGFEIELELEDGWYLTNKMRYQTADTLRNAIFSSGLVDVNAQGSNAGVGSLAHYNNRLADTTDTNLDYFRDSGITEFGYQYVNSSDTVQFDQGIASKSGWWSIDLPTESFINDFQLSKQIGDHAFTTGFYFTEYQDGQHWNILNDILLDVDSDDVKLVDVVGLDANGEVVTNEDGGALRATDNGFLRYTGGAYANATHQFTVAALYLTDEWQVSDELRIDYGLRLESGTISGAFEQSTTCDLGDATTLADDAVSCGTGKFTSVDETYEEANYSLGFNYTFSDTVSLYGRYALSNRLPLTRVFVLNSNNAGVTEEVQQTEAGIKWVTDDFSLYTTVFYSVLDGIPNNVVDSEGKTLEQTAGAEIPGIELESTWDVTADLSLALTATFQKPEHVNFGEFTGKRVQRVPETQISFRPSYYLMDGDMNLFMEWQYIGERYQDLNNVQKLPAYEVLSLGLTYNVTDNLTLQLRGNNITNEIGITEGDPRTTNVQGTTSDIYEARPILGRNFRISALYEF